MPDASPEVEIRARAQMEGFDAVGFTTASLPESARDGLAAYLAAGHHGDMAWMADTAARRGDPQTLWPDARSVVVLGVSYAPRLEPRQKLKPRERGVISVYARNRDYHDVVKKRLKALAGWMHRRYRAEVKVFVDTAPVMEKSLAVAAGLGWRGKHTGLVSPQYGGWLFLGTIFTTLYLAPDTPHPNRCGRCRACLDACPTDALRIAGQIDPRRCLSYLTIEHKGDIPPELAAQMGNRIYGCDDCYAACPWNRFAPPSRDPAFLPRLELVAPRLTDLQQLDEPEFRSLFAGTPVKRVGHERFQRNVAIALRNAAGASLPQPEAGPDLCRTLTAPETV